MDSNSLWSGERPSISSPTQKPENQPQQDRILKFTEKRELPKGQAIETLREGFGSCKLTPDGRPAAQAVEIVKSFDKMTRILSNIFSR
jgi:hypothetical protein